MKTGIVPSEWFASFLFCFFLFCGHSELISWYLILYLTLFGSPHQPSWRLCYLSFFTEIRLKDSEIYNSYGSEYASSIVFNSSQENFIQVYLLFTLILTFSFQFGPDLFIWFSSLKYVIYLWGSFWLLKQLDSFYFNGLVHRWNKDKWNYSCRKPFIGTHNLQDFFLQYFLDI